MSIDATTEPKLPSQLPHSKTLNVELLATKPRLAKRVVIALLIVAGVSAAAIAVTKSYVPEDTGPALTHKITRGKLIVTVTEQGLIESSENTEIKSGVRGRNAVLWIIPSGTRVKKGDELVRLDSLFIQEQIDERTKYAHWSQSAADHSAGRLARAELAVSEYEQGRYVTELMKAEKALVVAEARLRGAKDRLMHTTLMAKSEYKSELQVEERDFAVKQAELHVKLMRTQLDVLKRFTKKEQLQTLKGNLKSVKATHNANVERAMADKSRQQRALDEHKFCVVRAPRDGMVIHPNAAKWESGPIEEGTRVWKEQLLLLMPNLDKMQVKVGVHESAVERVKQGLSANVTLPNMRMKGKVSKVASVTRPAMWWTGNEVRYDTLVALPPHKHLRPGMSAEVEIVLAEYENVLKIPVAAIVEISDGRYCWVKTTDGPERRAIVLGDSDGSYTIVNEGLDEGEEVILNPHAFGDVQLQTGEESEEKEPDSKSTKDSKP